MTRILIFLLATFFFFGVDTNAQADTIIQPADEIDTVAQLVIPPEAEKMPQDTSSVSRKPYSSGAVWQYDPLSPLPEQLQKVHPYFGFGAEPVYTQTDLKRFSGKELLFYAILLLFLLFAMLRNAFAKYFNDLFRLFFRTTLKQKQIREQLMQTPLPSLLLNGFFVVSSSLYINFLLLHFSMIRGDDFWLYCSYCAAGISAIYLGKFIGLKIMGWLFGKPETANSYIFIVFIINKVIGVFLLPFLPVLAFSGGWVYIAGLVLSWAGLGVLLIYRFILTYAALRNQVKFNPFHFILYVSAFEIAPLLLIYKLLLVVFQ